MPEKDPMMYSFATYVWVMVLSLWGGITGFYHKVKSGTARAFNLTEFFGEIATSALSGLLVFWLCEQSDIPRLYGAVLIAVSGHMGSRAIFMMEKYLEMRIKRIASISEDEDHP